MSAYICRKEKCFKLFISIFIVLTVGLLKYLLVALVPNLCGGVSLEANIVVAIL